jgi:lipopolysaccharide transport system permease protein
MSLSSAEWTATSRRSIAIRRYAGLTRTLADREFIGAYRGNITGFLASLLVPLLMLATYTFVFSFLIPIRIRPEQSTIDYAFFLFSGLIAWNVFADVAARAPRLFLESPQYVTRPRFPLSVIVAAPCLASFYRTLPWLAAYVIVRSAFVEVPAATLWLAPLSLVWTSLLVFGFTLLLASIGTLVQDLADFVPPGLNLVFFLSPILYPAERLSELSNWILWLNPIASHVVMARSLIFEGTLPSSGVLIAVSASTLLVLAVGVCLYRIVYRVLQDVV